jgi:protein ImuB
MKRIACIRWKSNDCKLQIDGPRTSFPRSAWERTAHDALRRVDVQPTQSVDEAGSHAERGNQNSCKLQILRHCRRFSPIVGMEPTDDESILLDITGLAHLFGGEAALAEAIVSDFSQLGLAARVAVADTIGAAWAAARYQKREGGREKGEGGNPKSEIRNPKTPNSQISKSPDPSPFVIIPPGEVPAFLASLPLDALRLPDETVRLLGELGLTRIGELEGLPREELSSRFGPALLRRLDQAFGRLGEPLPACPSEPQFAARWSAEWPTARRETISAVVEQLIGRVAAMLQESGLGALRLECRLALEIDNRQSAIGNQQLSVGLFRPTAAAKHLFELVRLQLEQLRISAPVTDIYAAATLTAPLEPRRQATLFDQSMRHTPCAGSAHGVCGIQSDGLHFAALVERLGSRLGRQSVLGVRLRPETQPELSWHYDPLVGVKRRRKVLRTLRVRNRHAERADYNVPPRPLRLLLRPLPLAATSIAPDGPPLGFRHGSQEHKIAHAWGPERIETGWWRGRPVGRDYFRVETAAGRRFWLFRRLRDGKWFLHGMFE